MASLKSPPLARVAVRVTIAPTGPQPFWKKTLCTSSFLPNKCPHYIIANWERNRTFFCKVLYYTVIRTVVSNTFTCHLSLVLLHNLFSSQLGTFQTCKQHFFDRLSLLFTSYFLPSVFKMLLSVMVLTPLHVPNPFPPTTKSLAKHLFAITRTSQTLANSMLEREWSTEDRTIRVLPGCK